MQSIVNLASTKPLLSAERPTPEKTLRPQSVLGDNKQLPIYALDSCLKEAGQGDMGKKPILRPKQTRSSSADLIAPSANVKAVSGFATNRGGCLEGRGSSRTKRRSLDIDDLAALKANVMNKRPLMSSVMMPCHDPTLKSSLASLSVKYFQVRPK
jgi:hypothetical protein